MGISQIVQVWENPDEIPATSITPESIAFYSVPSRAYDLIRERAEQRISEVIKARFRKEFNGKSMLPVDTICDFIDYTVHAGKAGK